MGVGRERRAAAVAGEGLPALLVAAEHLGLAERVAAAAEPDPGVRMMRERVLDPQFRVEVHRREGQAKSIARAEYARTVEVDENVGRFRPGLSEALLVAPLQLKAARVVDLGARGRREGKEGQRRGGQRANHSRSLARKRRRKAGPRGEHLVSFSRRAGPDKRQGGALSVFA